MHAIRNTSIKGVVLAGMLALAGSIAAAAESATPASTASSAAKKPVARIPVKNMPADRTGKARKGEASYYGQEFHGRKMANGRPMNPRSNVAASKTLPLGTKAKVTNLENGKSEVVDIQDRGPYISGRIVDVTPETAEKLDFKKDGVASVEVKPLVVPQKSGGAKPVAGSTEK